MRVPLIGGGTYTNGKGQHGETFAPTPVLTLLREHVVDCLFPVVELDGLTGNASGLDTVISPEALETIQRRLIDASTMGHVEALRRVTEEIRGMLNPGMVKLENYKAVAADLRHRGQGFAPLGMHSDEYKVIENSAVWEAINKALEKHPHTITTVGTLDGCKRFFVSAQLSADGAGFEVNGERFNAYLNFITSHDGSLACQAYDSNTRIVCNNTLRASMGDARHRVSIRHTSGADVELKGVSAWISDALAGRVQFQQKYDQAMHTACDEETALTFLTGWFYRKSIKPVKRGSVVNGEVAPGENKRLSTRTRNQIDEIMERYLKGRGNKGQTFADLLNGVTEHYTSGSGVGLTKGGEQITMAERRMVADFGNAAAVKTEFARVILNADGSEYQEIVTVGRENGMEAYSGVKPVYMSGLERTRAKAAPAPVKVIDFSADVKPAPVNGGNTLADLLDAPLAPRV